MNIFKFLKRDEENVKRALSSIKSIEVPEDYWKSFWSRLQPRLNQSQVKVASSHQNAEKVNFQRFFGLAPALAAFALALWIGYRWGGQNDIRGSAERPQGQFINDEDRNAKAERVFREMLELFPDRLKWVTLASGEVDFGVSSTELKNSSVPLVPLIVSLFSPIKSEDIRLLIRPGQEVTVKGKWREKSNYTIRLSLDEKGHVIDFESHFNNSEVSAGMNSSNIDFKNEPISLGAIQFEGDMISSVIKTTPVPSSRSSTQLDPIRPRAKRIL
jgi:hypothetical protein